MASVKKTKKFEIELSLNVGSLKVNVCIFTSLKRQVSLNKNSVYRQSEKSSLYSVVSNNLTIPVPSRL